MLAPALALAGTVAWTLPAAAPVVPAVANGLGIERRTAGSQVALTFDDGPHPQGTPAVLEALERAGARATFFLVGEQVERRPALAAEIVAAGHEVALHGQRHRNLLRVSPRAVAEDIERGRHAVAQASGRLPVLHRPPYGIYSPAALALVRRRGLRPLLWSRWGRDWRARITPQEINAKVTRDIGHGDVLLLHDADFYSAEGSWRRTVAALPLVFEELERRGLRATAA